MAGLLLLPVTFYAQKAAVKTNLPYDAAATLNAGAEFKLGKRLTLDVPVSYNPWTFGGNKKLKHFMVQPELRRRVCEPFYSHFFGVHALYAHYNAGGIELPFGLLHTLKDFRYQGNLYGVGLSWGYQWVVSPRWNVEVSAGAGYVRLEHSKYRCRHCGEKAGNSGHNYLGPTKAALSLIYIIK